MPLYVAAGAAIVGAVAQGYSAYTQGQVASQAESQSSTIFGEQQYYEGQLQKLIADPSSVTSLPGYAFNLQQGAETVSRQMAAGGFSNSGNEAAALTQYGQSYAMNTYNQQVSILSQLAGITSASSPTQAGSVATAANANQSTQLANLLQELGMSYGMYGSAGGFPGAGHSDSTSTATAPAGGGYTYNMPSVGGQ